MCAGAFPLAEPHPSNCSCLACDCRMWLRFAYPPDQPIHTLKIATYGHASRGTGEPDRAIDPVVRDADYSVALAAVRGNLAWLGEASRSHPPRSFNEKLAVWRSDTEFINWLSIPPQVARWSALRLGRLRLVPDEPPWRSLQVLLDDCARGMALQMGQRIEGELRRKPEKVEPIATEESTEAEWSLGRMQKWTQRVGARRLVGYKG